MKLTVISHACMLFESGNDRLLVDPWILGSCYWRSWWHLPEARTDVFDPAAISAIYYTHEHTDHLHYPSLRRFPRSTRILVARFPVDRMAGSIRAQGYRNVEEIPHAGSVRVGSLQVFSYQYGLDDSAMVVTDGTTTVLNLNDTKVCGLALQQILRRHPRIDFLLHSHAPAQAYPFCYSAEDPDDLALLPHSYYIDSFIESVLTARPAHAIPFASNVCHLHPESVEQNRHLVSPYTVVEQCNARVPGTRAVVMNPGDSWTPAGGFVLSGPVVDRDAEIARLAEVYRDKLAQAADEEYRLPAVDFFTFRKFAERFVHDVPWILRRAYPARVAFIMEDDLYFIIDLGRACVERRIGSPGDVHSIVQVNPHMLRDAIAKNAVSLVNISKRVNVHLLRGGLVYDAAFWGLLSVHDLGYLPLSNTLRWRGITVLLRRWRELLGYIPVFLRPSKSLERVIDMASPDA